MLRRKKEPQKKSIFIFLTHDILVIFVIVFFFLLYSVVYGDVIIDVNCHDDLAKIVGEVRRGTTVLLSDGVYKLSRPIVVETESITIKSRSGNRDGVVLDGKVGSGSLERKNCIKEILSVRASNIKVEGIGICHARDHGIHISPSDRGTITNIVLNNIHVYDCGQQLIKVNSNGIKPLYWVDDSVLENSLIEFRDNTIMDDKGGYFYTGGLDVHGGRNWVIRNNEFRNIQREGRMMEHAVHMWSKCRDTVVESNLFVNCYRAIGFGMKTRASGFVRMYIDGKGEMPYSDHIGGVIKDNTITNSDGIHLESGIELMNVIDVKVLNNRVLSCDKPFSSIEYRWPDTKVEIRGNVVSHSIRKRNNAEAVLENNVIQQTAR